MILVQRKTHFFRTCLSVCALLLAIDFSFVQAQTPTPTCPSSGISWTRLLGGTSLDLSYGVGLDMAGNSFYTGSTESNPFDGLPTAGNGDAFFVKYNSDGGKQWIKILGGTEADVGRGVAIDSSGNSFFIGYTRSNPFDGLTGAGSEDVFVTKYDIDGVRLWTRLLGGSSPDYGYGIAVDFSGNAYVTGYTWSNPFEGLPNAGATDVFVAKYDGNGNRLWTRILGGSGGEGGRAVALDNLGNIYVVGLTASNPFDGQANAGNEDVFVTKYNEDGTKQWTRLLGGSDLDDGYGIAVDYSNNVYVTGRTESDIFDGQMTHARVDYPDVFVTKFNSNGGKLWTRVLGGNLVDWGRGIAVDSTGDTYITGVTNSNPFDGQTTAGTYDVFVTKYDSNGDKLWTHSLGESNRDVAWGIGLDNSGNAYVTGYTYSDFFEGQAIVGSADVFAMKFCRMTDWTATPTPTETPNHKPYVALGGYWDTTLTQRRGGNLTMYFYGWDPTSASLLRLEWGGLVLQPNPEAPGLYNFSSLLNFGLPIGRHLLASQIFSETGEVSFPWPYLTVE